jgi:outer membrane autotransporter protein
VLTSNICNLEAVYLDIAEAQVSRRLLQLRGICSMHLINFRNLAALIVLAAIAAPRPVPAQNLNIDNNTSVTADPGTTTFGNVVAGVNSGTVAGVPGGTFVVPTGSTVVVSNLFAGFAPGSTGLITVDGGAVTTVNPQSQYFIGFNGSGTMVVSNGGTVFSNLLTFIGANPGSSGSLTVTGQGSAYTSGFFLVGDQGPGQLTVTNGGVASATPTATLQIGANSSGTALVSGTGSLISAGTFLGVGVNPTGVGMLTITDGGMATSGSGTYLAFNPGAIGTILVSNGGTLTSPQLVVGSSGTGDLQVQSNGTVAINGPAIVGAIAGKGSVEVSGPGAALTVQNLIVGGQGDGTMTISDQGIVSVTSGGGTFIAGQCSGFPSFCPSPVQGGSGAVTVTGPGTVLNAGTILSVGQFGAGTLTIANGAEVFAESAFIAQNSGSTGTLNIGAAAGQAPVAPGSLNTPTLTFGAGTGDIVFNHTDNTGRYVFAPAISGTGAVDVFSGNTVMTGLSDYFGLTTIHGGTLSAGAANVFSPNSDYTVQTGATLNLNGHNQTVASLSNAGLVTMGNGTPPGTLLTATNYIGNGGTIAMNTFLGTDGSPSDRLVINGGSATGNSLLKITNAGGPGAQTTANGIEVVQTINGGTTAPGAFTLANGELRAGAFVYDLFRGGVNGSDPEDWFLRSTGVNGQPIIGPEQATYGVVQPLARQLGLATLGTLHERIGDTLAQPALSAKDCCFAPAGPVWVRGFAQQIDNHYAALADPRAAGSLAGFQSGIDFWRGSTLPGHLDVWGAYLGYGHVSADAKGLVTNAATTAFVLQKTGTVKLDAVSGGVYWTHYGPTGWYLDAVGQVTGYDTTAATQFARLKTSGTGEIASLEAGYPFPMQLFCACFVLEPEAQILWQGTQFDSANDGLGPIALGSTSGATGRLGLRGKWTVLTPGGQLWQPYVLANLWQDWGGNVTTSFTGEPVPLREEATRLEFSAGLTVRFQPNISLFAQGGYQFAVGSDGGQRDGAKGNLGFRFTW